MFRYTVLALLLTSPAVAQDAGTTAWAHIHEVLSHPRCANCHVGADNIPIWSGRSYGSKQRPHGMNINAGDSRVGAETILCSACHATRNSQLAHGPPGAPGWSLPPVSMQWFDKSSAEICAQIKEETKDDAALAKIVDHIKHEPLVQWGWAPGPGREPAPYSAAEVAEFLKQWNAAGAPCPEK